MLPLRACHLQCLATRVNRRVFRYWRFYLGCVIGALLLSATDMPAATITVTNGNDSGAGSLRRAILFALLNRPKNAKGIAVVIAVGCVYLPDGYAHLFEHDLRPSVSEPANDEQG